MVLVVYSSKDTVSLEITHRSYWNAGSSQGTGKTAAFTLPLLQHLMSDGAGGRRRRPVRALIVVPTRELAAQITAEIHTLAKGTRIKAISIYGGVGQRPQVSGLRGRPDVIVACPGRLLDLIQQGHAKLDTIEALVLDEADHMFDMGFLEPIRKIIEHLPVFLLFFLLRSDQNKVKNQKHHDHWRQKRK